MTGEIVTLRTFDHESEALLAQNRLDALRIPSALDVDRGAEAAVYAAFRLSVRRQDVLRALAALGVTRDPAREEWLD